MPTSPPGCSSLSPGQPSLVRAHCENSSLRSYRPDYESTNFDTFEGRSSFSLISRRYAAPRFCHCMCSWARRMCWNVNIVRGMNAGATCWAHSWCSMLPEPMLVISRHTCMHAALFLRITMEPLFLGERDARETSSPLELQCHVSSGRARLSLFATRTPHRLRPCMT